MYVRMLHKINFYIQDLCVNDYTVFPKCNSDDSICIPNVANQEMAS